jgi:hypothetical protein
MMHKTFDLFGGTYTTGLDSIVADLLHFTGFSAQFVYDNVAPAAKNFLAGELCINTVTYAAKISMTAGEFTVVTDTSGNKWAVAATSAPASSAIWTAIPAGRKAICDLSSATTDVEVAALFELSFDGLVGFTALCVTDDTPADGKLTFTHVVRAPVVAIACYSGTGVVSIIVTNNVDNVGVASTVAVLANTITISGHGLVTGLKGQLTTTGGTLPTGVTTGTDYFVIYIDVDTIKLAASLADAIAGTPKDLTNQGSEGETFTFTATALTACIAKLQGSNDGTNYTDLASQTVTITGDGSSLFNQYGVYYRYVKANLAMTAGQLTISGKLITKGE